MTRDERIRAFSLRCDGLTWEEIGAAMSYDGQSVAKDLRSVLEKSPRIPDVRSPAIKAYLLQECGGSLSALAARMGVSPYRLRRVLVYGDRPSQRLLAQLLAVTGLSESEAFPERRST